MSNESASHPRPSSEVLLETARDKPEIKAMLEQALKKK